MSIPDSIGKYSVEGVLGKGAMGLVYRAVDPLLGREVALKVITGDEVTDEMKERFRIEARAAAALAHPNIVVIFDLGEESGTPYIAMELLKGEDLRSLVTRRRDLSVEECAELMVQVCDGLSYAHERRIVHRDIKPANIHVCPDGRVKIVDFGIAKMDSTSLTKTGMVIGTPDYMSPEQIQGKAVDQRSDIFSVGVVFYELLAGDKPFSAESITSVIYNIVFKQPTPFAELQREVPAEVERIVRKAMAKDLADRYQRMGDMAADIRKWLASRGRGVLPAAAAVGGDSDATQVLTPSESAGPHAGATRQVGEAPSARAAVAGERGDRTAAMGSQPREMAGGARRSKAPLIAGVAVGLVAIVATAIVLLRGGREEVTPPVAASPVPVEILVVPWARVDRLVGLDDGGAEVAVPPEGTTPLRIDLPPGRYRADVSNPDFGSGSFDITVSGTGPVRATHVLGGFDAAAAFGEIGR